MPFLELTDIQKFYGQSLAVDTFNLAVERGEFVSFLGPSGCGKTTTLRMIAGFETPSAGSITIGGVDVTRTPPNRRSIGMVFQSYALFPNMTVADNIGFGLKVAGKPASEIQSRVDEMLRIISMEPFGRRYPYQLSGGQQQRVALARALAIEPKLLLLDEPLSALDAKIRVSLRQEIRDIQRRLGITTIYVTHDQEEAMALSDRIVVMSRGRMEQVGTPFEVYNFPQTRFVASFVGMLNLLEAHVLDLGGRIAVDGQELRLAQPLPADSQAARLTLAVRPEALTLDRSHSPNGVAAPQVNRLRGIVEEITFLGALVRVRLRLTEQRLHFDLFNTPQLAPPRAGEEIVVRFAPEAAMLLGDEPPDATTEASTDARRTRSR